MYQLSVVHFKYDKVFVYTIKDYCGYSVSRGECVPRILNADIT